MVITATGQSDSNTMEGACWRIIDEVLADYRSKE